MKEQDEVIVITVLCGLVGKIARLYQIPNWSQQNNLELSDWIYDTYKFEMFSTVYAALKSPPPTDGKVWRLTPDTIREWIAPALEKVAQQREHWHQNKNAKVVIEPIEGLEQQYKEIQSRRLKEWEVEDEKKKMKQTKYLEMQQRWKEKYTVNVEAMEDEIKKRDEQYLKETGQLETPEK